MNPAQEAIRAIIKEANSMNGKGKTYTPRMNKTKKEVLKALKDPSNYKPDVTGISKKTGIPITTVWDAIKQLKKHKVI